MARFFIFCFMALVFTAITLEIPPRYLPWAPLDLADSPGPFTRAKLGKLRDDPQQCAGVLAAARILFQQTDDDGTKTCPLSNIAVLTKSGYAYSSSVKGNCALLAALVMWERHAVAPAAAAHLSEEISRIDHVGIFACRNVRGSQTRISQHAHARAIDIAGFRLKDGRDVRVERDWGKETPEGLFLQDVRSRSCPIFNGVLGPDYNALHRDHFHLDLGRYSICR